MEETRARIVAAASSVLSEGRPLTLQGVAERATVSRPTMYHHFGSRAGLLRAVIDEMSVQGRLGETIDASGRTDPLEGMEAWLRGAVRFWWQAHPVLAPAILLTQTDPELAPVFAAEEKARRARAAHIVGRLHHAGCLDPGWSRHDATDLLWLLSGVHAFQQFRSRGKRALEDVILRAAQAIVNTDALRER
jgi:AcrR family transcriptional regulator